MLVMMERRRQRNRDSVVEEKGQRLNCGGRREVRRSQPELCGEEERTTIKPSCCF